MCFGSYLACNRPQISTGEQHNVEQTSVIRPATLARQAVEFMVLTIHFFCIASSIGYGLQVLQWNGLLFVCMYVRALSHFI